MDSKTLNKMTKKELLDICENLKFKSYKSKNKSELIELIEINEKSNKLTEPKNKYYSVIEIESDDSDDSDIENETNLNEMEKIFNKSNDESDTKEEQNDLVIGINNLSITKNEENKKIDTFSISITSDNIVLETYEDKQKKKYERKIDELYEMLHNANIRSLNYQFKYRSQYPIAVYNNLQELKKRINMFNV